jgi:hypothetical protein
MLSDADIQRLIARRTRMLEPRDLAPRRPDELIGRPISSRAGNGPFDGKLAGTVAGKPVEVFLENHGRVTGTLGVGPELTPFFKWKISGVGPELVRIEGMVEDDTLRFTWKSADSQGTGVLHRHGDAYEGTAPLWPTKDASVWALTAVRLAGTARADQFALELGKPA